MQSVSRQDELSVYKMRVQLETPASRAEGPGGGENSASVVSLQVRNPCGYVFLGNNRRFLKIAPPLPPAEAPGGFLMINYILNSYSEMVSFPNKSYYAYFIIKLNHFGKGILGKQIFH